MGGPDAFWSGGVLCQNTLPKAVLLGEKTDRRFCKLGYALMPDCGVHYLWFAFACFLIRSHPPPPPERG